MSLFTPNSSDLGAIIGGVVGGVGGALCLLLVLLVVFGFLLTRRKENREKKLTQPNYDELAFGDVDNISVPKYKAQEVGCPLSDALHRSSLSSLPPSLTHSFTLSLA